jgi:hypothetical protein
MNCVLVEHAQHGRGRYSILDAAVTAPLDRDTESLKAGPPCFRIAAGLPNVTADENTDGLVGHRRHVQ